MRLIIGKAAAILLLAALSFIVIYKAVRIPVTFDESSTFGICQQPIWQVMMNQNWDGSPSNWPNNHILNTILMKYSSALFGTQPWALRLPNILAFVLFAASIYLLSVRFFSDSAWLLCVPIVFMFGNPYLVDFFSLGRGYGMGSSFMGCSILGLLVYTSSQRMRWYYIAVIFAGLALYAQFTFLLYWLALHLFLFALFLREGLSGRRIWHELLATVITASAFAALCWYPLIHTQKGISHDYPAAGGFFETTILTSAANFIYTKQIGDIYAKVLGWTVIGIVIMCGIYCFRKVLKTLPPNPLKVASIQNPRGLLKPPLGGLGVLNDLLVILFMLLALVWFINVLEANIFHTMYPGQRTALIYHVLFAFVLMFLVRDMIITNISGAKALTVVIMLLFIVHFSMAVNLKSVREWSYDAYTYDVVNYIDSYRQKQPDAKIGLKLGGHFFPSFFYYHYMNYNKLRWLDMVSRYDTVTQPLFFYATAEEKTKLKNYIPVQVFGPDSQVLMIHR